MKCFSAQVSIKGNQINGNVSSPSRGAQKIIDLEERVTEHTEPQQIEWSHDQRQRQSIGHSLTDNSEYK